MSKSPAFQFYPADYLSDGNVALMTLEQEGAYTRLLCYCWQEGYIPNVIEALAMYCRVTADKMATLWPGIKKCFETSEKDPEKLVHPRLEKERKKQKDFQKMSTRRGRKGAEARWGKGIEPYAKSIDQAMQKNSSISSSISSTSVERKVKKKDFLSGVPEGFQITERITRWATENQFTTQALKVEFPAFVDHHQAKGSKFKDWDAAFQTWMRNSRKFGNKRFPGSSEDIFAGAK